MSSIAGLGYKGVEILCDYPHWFPGRVSDADVENTVALLSDLKLAVSNLNANAFFQPLPPENVFEPSLSSANSEHRLWRQCYTVETIRLAQVPLAHRFVTGLRPVPVAPIPSTSGGRGRRCEI